MLNFLKKWFKASPPNPPAISREEALQFNNEFDIESYICDFDEFYACLLWEERQTPKGMLSTRTLACIAIARIKRFGFHYYLRKNFR